MFKIFSTVACALVLFGCASHKPPQAKGRWTAVNPVGYIPPNVTKYREKTQDLPQDIELKQGQESD